MTLGSLSHFLFHSKAPLRSGVHPLPPFFLPPTNPLQPGFVPSTPLCQIPNLKVSDVLSSYLWDGPSAALTQLLTPCFSKHSLLLDPRTLHSRLPFSYWLLFLSHLGQISIFFIFWPLNVKVPQVSILRTLLHLCSQILYADDTQISISSLDFSPDV